MDLDSSILFLILNSSYYKLLIMSTFEIGYNLLEIVDTELRSKNYTNSIKILMELEKLLKGRDDPDACNLLYLTYTKIGHCLKMYALR
jgi:hypothetical protein